jgi:hypothetical protein
MERDGIQTGLWDDFIMAAFLLEFLQIGISQVVRELVPRLPMIVHSFSWLVHTWRPKLLPDIAKQMDK